MGQSPLFILTVTEATQGQ